MNFEKPIGRNRWNSKKPWSILLVLIGFIFLPPGTAKAGELETLLQNKNYPAAESWLTHRITEHPKDSRLYYQLGTVYRLQGKYDLMHEAFNTSLGLDSRRKNNIVHAYVNLADTFGRQKKWQQMQEAFNRARQVAKDVNYYPRYLQYKRQYDFITAVHGKKIGIYPVLINHGNTNAGPFRNVLQKDLYEIMTTFAADYNLALLPPQKTIHILSSANDGGAIDISFTQIPPVKSTPRYTKPDIQRYKDIYRSFPLQKDKGEMDGLLFCIICLYNENPKQKAPDENPASTTIESMGKKIKKKNVANTTMIYIDTKSDQILWGTSIHVFSKQGHPDNIRKALARRTLWTFRERFPLSPLYDGNYFIKPEEIKETASARVNLLTQPTDNPNIKDLFGLQWSIHDSSKGLGFIAGNDLIHHEFYNKKGTEQLFIFSLFMGAQYNFFRHPNIICTPFVCAGWYPTMWSLEYEEKVRPGKTETRTEEKSFWLGFAGKYGIDIGYKFSKNFGIWIGYEKYYYLNNLQGRGVGLTNNQYSTFKFGFFHFLLD